MYHGCRRCSLAVVSTCPAEFLPFLSGKKKEVAPSTRTCGTKTLSFLTLEHANHEAVVVVVVEAAAAATKSSVLKARERGENAKKESGQMRRLLESTRFAYVIIPSSFESHRLREPR